MSSLPWVRFFPSDWLAGTRGMSAAETGIYITLIATMYERGEPIPEDRARLSRLCGASASAFGKALDALIDDGKIQRCEGGLWNERVSRESKLCSEKSEVAARNANARWSKNTNKNNGSVDATALPTQCTEDANQNQNQIKKEEPSVLSSSSLRSDDGEYGERERATPVREAAAQPLRPRIDEKALTADFDDWWQAYPRKVSKGHARTAYTKARQAGITTAALKAGAIRYGAEVAGSDPRFIKHPATWLNGEGWLDEPAAPAPPEAFEPRAGSVVGIAEARRRQGPLTGTASALAGILSAGGLHHDD